MVFNNHYKTWIEIDKKSVISNIKTFRLILKPKTKLFAVVKSNAYGHGLILFSGLADKLGVDGFCVDSIIEGRKLRAVGIKKPILCLGPTLPGLFEDAINGKIILTISNLEALSAFAKSGKFTNFHIKIDTGMHRQGFYLNEIPKALRIIKNPKSGLGSFLKGIYTHFAAAKDVTYPSYTLRQLNKFEEANTLFKKAGFKNLLRHAAATGGAILYPQSHFDFVRIGAGLYGFWPTRETKVQHQLVLNRKLMLKPILSWRSVVSEVKDLIPGDLVGYDLTEEITKPVTAAIIPIGYWHGFSRALSGCGRVLINGLSAKVLGRVSMDLLTVALPRGLKAKIGDRVTLIGRDKKEIIRADDLAEITNGISYEVITRLNPLIERFLV
ncbi:MAG: alanine racemase [Patescibacteria group bacterium]|nr:alanine racemase [Patescibacteria group bacterium]